MKFEKVVSSNIEAVGYCKQTRILGVKYKSGIYLYADVPEFVYTQLMEAESKGSFVSTLIKNAYNYTMLENMKIHLPEIVETKGE